MEEEIKEVEETSGWLDVDIFRKAVNVGLYLWFFLGIIFIISSVFWFRSGGGEPAVISIIMLSFLTFVRGRLLYRRLKYKY